MDTLFEIQAPDAAAGRAYRVLVTGSRTWGDPDAVGRALGDAARAAAGADRDRLVVVHGDCPAGADRFARNWARKAGTSGLPVAEEGHPADWARHGTRRAGFIRNAEMVAAGADVCLAFIAPCVAVKCQDRIPHDSHGTADCLLRARSAGIPVRRYES